MEAVFQVCLSNTMVALVLAALAALARALGLRPALVHGLWVLVLVKLVTPPVAWISIGTPAARRAAAPARSIAAARPRPSPDVAPSERAARPPAGASAATAAPAPAATTSRAGRPSGGLLRSLSTRIPAAAEAMALAAWLAIALLWWGRTAARVRRFGRCLRWAEPAPVAVQEAARALAPRLGLRRAPEVRFVPAPISPMLWALASRPLLLVPAALWEMLDEGEREALLAHELAHFRRRDHWVRLLEIGVTGLYWWNPLVWWARRSLRDAEEWCCDAWVVRTLPGRAGAYARAILKTLDFLAEAPGVEPMGGTGLASAGALKRRLVRILAGRASGSVSWPGTVTVIALAAASLAMGPAYVPPRSFRAMDLGSLGGPAVTGFRLNDRGQVAGWSSLIDPNDPTRRRSINHPFRTAPDRPINPDSDDLADRIGATAPAEIRQFGAYDINNLGQVLVWAHGNWSVLPGEAPQFDRGFLVDGERVVELAPGQAPTPAALNDSGQIAGFIRRPRRGQGGSGPFAFQLLDQDTDRIAFRAPAGQSVALARDDLGHLRGRPRAGRLDTIARDINANGQVAGDSVMADGTVHAFRTAPGRPIDPVAGDLGTFADPRSPSDDRGMSRARAINDRGQVVGTAGARGGGSHRAFRTAPDRPIDPDSDDLGTLGGENSEAMGINNRGEVVGQADLPPDPGRPSPHAFLFADGRMIDLNATVELESGWVLVCAMDINDRGQIVAVAREEATDPSTVQQRAYLLTPAPEPAPLAMLVLGTAVTGSGIALRRRRTARARK